MDEHLAQNSRHGRNGRHGRNLAPGPHVKVRANCAGTVASGQEPSFDWTTGSDCRLSATAPEKWAKENSPRQPTTVSGGASKASNPDEKCREWIHPLARSHLFTCSLVQGSPAATHQAQAFLCSLASLGPRDGVSRSRAGGAPSYRGDPYQRT
jgi:hypothetical protein